VGINPRDRANSCKGQLKAFWYLLDRKNRIKGIILEFKCLKCGKVTRNKAIRSGTIPDSFDAILALKPSWETTWLPNCVGIYFLFKYDFMNDKLQISNIWVRRCKMTLRLRLILQLVVTIIFLGCKTKVDSEVKVVGGIGKPTEDSGSDAERYFEEVAQSTVEVSALSLRCSGVLISSRNILTAAHCIKRSLPNHLITFRGNVFITIPTTYIKVHEKYSFSSGADLDDIAILTIPLGVQIPQSYKPAKIVKKTDSLASKFIAAGFGMTKSNAEGLQLTPIISLKNELSEKTEFALCMKLLECAKVILEG
jgi:hypothetical protein